MTDSIYLQKLAHYMQKHHGLPSLSALPLVFNTDLASTRQIVEAMAEHEILRMGPNGEIEPGKCFPTESSPLSSAALPAGLPIELSDSLDSHLNIHAYLVPMASKTIIVPISGDSMVDAGINDGDLAVIDTGLQANAGDIVAAEIDGKFTLKRLLRAESGDFFLKAENAAYPALLPRDSLRVHGVLVGLARRY